MQAASGALLVQKCTVKTTKCTVLPPHHHPTAQLHCSYIFCQVTKEEYAAKGATALGSALVQQLSSQGLNPYYIPVGGSSALGVWGYLQAVEELRQQTQELGLKFDVIASVSEFAIQ